jgi:hypothetical protein
MNMLDSLQFCNLHSICILMTNLLVGYVVYMFFEYIEAIDPWFLHEDYTCFSRYVYSKLLHLITIVLHFV